MENRVWLVPEYLDEFKCKCGDCRNSCCGGWQIAVGMNEYFRLIGMECSEGLHRKLESAFAPVKTPSPERYRVISPNWLGKCPMQDEDGLCSLQKECGAEALPDICCVYPRSFRKNGELLEACGSASCEGIAELLLKTERLQFRFENLDAKPELEERDDEVFQKAELRCARILNDRKVPLNQRLASTFEIASGFPVPVGRVADGLRETLSLLEALLEECLTLEPYAKVCFERYGGDDAEKRYQNDIEALERAFPTLPTGFENLMFNHMIFIHYPYADERISGADAIYGFAAAYAVLRVVCACHMAEHSSFDDLVDAVSAVFHLTEHTPFYYNARVIRPDAGALLSL